MPPPPPLLAANQLLAVLARHLRPPLLADLEPVALAVAQVLVVPGARMHHVYFPTAGVVALLAQVADHRPVAVGMVGTEGLLGLSMVCGTRVAAMGAIVQVAGTALRLPAHAWRRRSRCGGCSRRWGPVRGRPGAAARAASGPGGNGMTWKRGWGAGC